MEFVVVAGATTGGAVAAAWWYRQRKGAEPTRWSVTVTGTLVAAVVGAVAGAVTAYTMTAWLGLLLIDVGMRFGG